MNLKPGNRLRSATDTTEVVVVRSGPDDVDLRCGGTAMVPHGVDAPDAGPPAAGFDAGTKVGKRYEDADTGCEVLCTKAGSGSLSIGARELTLKDAKALPSSD